MENENFAAPKPNEPLMSQTNQGQVKQPVVAVIEEDESKKKFLPQGENNDGVHFKKDYAQVEIKQTPKFIGLTQEELQRYADDPFWRKLRLALFVLFWLSWILMFAIAIILVVTSPKCPSKPERFWWHKQLCYQAYTRSFKDSDGDGVGDFKGMKEKVYELSRFHIKTIWPFPVLESKNFTGYDVTDFKKVDSRLGTMEDFEDLIRTAHEHKMHVIIDLPVTTMSTESYWFSESTTRSDPPYNDFFYWKSEIPAGQGSLWVKNTKRDQYYRVFSPSASHTDVWPVLNWNSTSLQNEFKNITKFWIDKGIDGFYIGFVHLLSINDDGTSNWDKIVDHVRILRNVVQEHNNNTGKEVALFTSISKEILDDHNHIKDRLLGPDGLHYILNTELTTIDEQCDAQCIRGHLVKLQEFHAGNNDSWPVWELGNPFVSRVASRLGENREKAELLQMLLFMLEGSINTYYGDELGLYDTHVNHITLPRSERFTMRNPMQWNDGKNAGFSDSETIPIQPNPDYATNNMKEALAKSFSAAKLFRKMAEWRFNDESFLYGKMEIAPPHNTTVAVKRTAYYSSPNYYAVMNFANVTLSIST